MNQYNNFTKTDKTVNIMALILITFLVGYKPIFESILGDIIGGILAVAGGIIAAQYTLYLSKKADKEKEDTLLTNTRKSLINILESVYLVGINEMIQDCEKLKLFILKEEESLIVSNTIFIENDLFEVLDKTLVIKVLSQHNIGFDRLISLIVLLRYNAENTPVKIRDNYFQMKNEQIEQRKKDLDFVCNNKDLLSIDYENARTEIDMHAYYFSTGLLKTTLDKFDFCKNHLIKLEKLIQDLLNELKI